MFYRQRKIVRASYYSYILWHLTFQMWYVDWIQLLLWDDSPMNIKLFSYTKVGECCGLLGWTVDGFSSCMCVYICLALVFFFQNLFLWTHMSSQMELTQMMLRFTSSSKRSWLTIAEPRNKFIPWLLEYVLYVLILFFF